MRLFRFFEPRKHGFFNRPFGLLDGKDGGGPACIKDMRRIDEQPHGANE